MTSELPQAPKPYVPPRERRGFLPSRAERRNYARRQKMLPGWRAGQWRHRLETGAVVVMPPRVGRG